MIGSELINVGANKAIFTKCCKCNKLKIDIW